MQELIDNSEPLDVRLTQLTAEAADDIPQEVNAEFTISDLKVQGSDGEGESFLRVHVSHQTRFFTQETTIGTINFTHVIRFAYRGDERPDRDAIQRWVTDNVYFMLYPYVRQVLHNACTQLGLPAVVLGYLRRGQMAPRAISVVVQTTRFDENITPPAPADEQVTEDE